MQRFFLSIYPKKILRIFRLFYIGVWYKFLLENRKDSYGSVALLEKELDLERINRELIVVDAFIAAITAHKATL